VAVPVRMQTYAEFAFNSVFTIYNMSFACSQRDFFAVSVSLINEEGFEPKPETSVLSKLKFYVSSLITAF
jgi:hypothetical protein